MRTAEEHEAQVVSNDEFEQDRTEFPWIKRRRVPYMIISHSVQLYLPKLNLPVTVAVPGLEPPRMTLDSSESSIPVAAD